MSQLYSLSRVLVAFLGLSEILGVVWFSGSLNGKVIVTGLLIGLSSIAVAFVPQQRLSSRITRRVLITLCSVGIISGIFSAVVNFNEQNNLEWDVLITKFVHIIALAFMATRALPWSSQTKSA